MLNTDYSVEYSNNTNAGTATVTITALATSEDYAGETTKTFTINPATLTAVTLEQTELMYNIFEPVAQTANVADVKAGTLVVPTTDYGVEGNTQTEIGIYTVTVTGKNNFTGTATAQFVITNHVVDGDAEKTQTGEDVDDVDLTISVVDPHGADAAD